jgi:hypothetical protein
MLMQFLGATVRIVLATGIICGILASWPVGAQPPESVAIARR